MRFSGLVMVGAMVAAAASGMAQERAAGQANDAQVNWSALSSQIGLVSTQNKILAQTLDKYNTCGAKTMLFVQSAVSADNTDGCVSMGGTFPSDYCYATRAGRWVAPHCDKDYYMKAQIKATDNNWDGYSGVCCYMNSGKDARVEANKAGFATLAGAITSSVGLSYQQIAGACATSPGTYGGNNVTCPPADVLK